MNYAAHAHLEAEIVTEADVTMLKTLSATGSDFFLSLLRERECKRVSHIMQAAKISQRID